MKQFYVMIEIHLSLITKSGYLSQKNGIVKILIVKMVTMLIGNII